MLAVAGAGYVGLATAVGFARQGHEVTLFDISKERVASLRAGVLPFQEPSIDGAFQAVLGKTLTVEDISEANLQAFEYMLICVPTPPLPDGSLDTTAVFDVAMQVASASDGCTKIVNRSTVLPGTAAAIEAQLRTRFPHAMVLANPEFLREGSALADFDNPDRRVVGGSDPAVVEAFSELYSFCPAPLIETDATTAELIKVASNAALAVRVSMANEIADVANALGVDADQVLDAVGADPRIGNSYLKPGIGFGGACLPKDLGAYRAIGRVLHTRTGVFDGTAATNDEAITRLADRVVGLLNGSRAGVCVVGLGFKRGSDQVRDSQAMPFVEALLDRELAVSVVDPLAEENARRVLRDRVNYLDSIEGITDEQRVVVFTQGAQGADCRLPSNAIAIDGTGRLLTSNGRIE